MRIELTREGLLVYLANHYIPPPKKKTKMASEEIDPRPHKY